MRWNQPRPGPAGAGGLNGFAAAEEPNTKPKAGPLPGGFAGPTTTGVPWRALWRGNRRLWR